MTYPIPPDAREPQSFDIVRGFDTMQRHDLYIADANAAGVDTPPEEVQIGTPLRFLSGTGSLEDTVFICNDGLGGAGYRVVGDVGAAPTVSERFAGICWTHYTDDFEGGGFPDALGNRKVTVLRGKFTLRMKITELFITPASDPAAAVAPLIGRQVVAVNCENAAGDTFGKFAALPDGVNKFAGGNPTSQEAVAFMDCVLGEITKVDGDFVDVDFDI